MLVVDVTKPEPGQARAPILLLCNAFYSAYKLHRQDRTLGKKVQDVACSLDVWLKRRYLLLSESVFEVKSIVNLAASIPKLRFRPFALPCSNHFVQKGYQDLAKPRNEVVFV